MENLEEQALTISSALYRFASFLGDPALAESIQKNAVHLLDTVVCRKYDAAIAALRSVRCLSRLGEEVGIISSGDAEVLQRSLAVCEKNLKGAQAHEAVHFNLQTSLEAVSAIENKSALKELTSGNPATQSNAAIRQPAKQDDEAAKQQKERRKKIAGVIRQSGNARLRDIQEALPDTSERTLRYDLQALLKQGKVERVGNGGAGSYYRASTVPAATGGTRLSDVLGQV